MSGAAGWVLFDVNETLSDIEPLAQRFADVGVDRSLLRTWFAATLRDGMAATLAGSAAAFRDVGRDVLLDLFAAQQPPDRPAGEAAEHVLDGFGTLGLHPDVAPGVDALRAAGWRLATLSNGAAEVAEDLLTRGGIRDRFDQVLSVDGAGAWKPDPRAYAYGVGQCAATAGETVLVAVHPWDLHGARRAGLRTAWLRRGDRPWPAVFDAPDHTVDALAELVPLLA